MTPIIVYARSPAEEQNRMPNFWDEPCLCGNFLNGQHR